MLDVCIDDDVQRSWDTVQRAAASKQQKSCVGAALPKCESEGSEFSYLGWHCRSCQEFLTVFIETYESQGGPKLDFDQLKAGVILTALENMSHHADSPAFCLLPRFPVEHHQTEAHFNLAQTVMLKKTKQKHTHTPTGGNGATPGLAELL